MEVHRGTKIHDSKKGEKETKRRSRWRRPIHAVPSEPRPRPRPCMSLHWPNDRGATERTKKTRILVGTVLEVEIGPKATALGRRRTFVVARFDLSGGAMKVSTINIQSVKLHTPEPPRTSIGGDGGERDAAATTTTTGDTTVTDPVEDALPIFGKGRNRD